MWMYSENFQKVYIRSAAMWLYCAVKTSRRSTFAQLPWVSGTNTLFDGQFLYTALFCVSERTTALKYEYGTRTLSMNMELEL